MEAAVVAGGLGTRMAGVAAGVPKSLLPVRGKPLLEHQLRWLRACGFSQITLCLGHKAELVKERFGGEKGLRFAVETKPRGTAGCIKDLAPKGDVLVVYGDLYPEIDMKPLFDFHGKHPQAAATLVLLETDHPEDSDLAELDGDRIKRIYRGGPGRTALAAVWIVRASLLALIPSDSPTDFGRDIFPEALKRGIPIMGCRMKGVLADVGTPERLARLS